MPDDFIKFAFSAGVLSERLHGRADLEKFDLGLKDANNFFVDYRGGASTRPAFEFIDYLKESDKAHRIVRFRFNSQLANNYLLLFGENYLRFVQNGGYVLEAAATITGVTNANPGVVTTSAPHGYSNGDWVQLAAVGGIPELALQTLVVANVTASTFELTWWDGSNFNTSALGTYTSGGTVSRVYTVATPYAAADLAGLGFDQFRDEIHITSTAYFPRTLTRVAATNWTLALTDFTGNATAPSGLTLNPSSAATAGVLFGVTAVNLDGEESHIGDYELTELTVDYTSTAGSLEATWTAVPDTLRYRIYRSLVLPTGADISLAQQLGYLGESVAPRFVDNNIIPDFTQQPPRLNNPFADGAIQHINITAGGTGYNKTTTTVSVSGGGGSGFVGAAIVEGGAIIGVIIQDAGTGYSSPTVSFGGAGTGATATATASPLTGNYPRISVPVQQRRVYAGTLNFPMTLYGSRPGLPNNFSSSDQATQGDAFELALDDPEVDPIKYALGIPGGLMVFTAGSLHIIRGSDDAVISGTTAKAEPQQFDGIGDVPPLRVGNEIIYVGVDSTEVLSLQPNAIRTFYESQDRSIFSSHLFTKANPVVSWTFAKNPYRMAWAAQSNGTFLSFTYVAEQNVYAWMPHKTKGFVENFESVKEDSFDRVYAITRRKINGTTRRYLERLRSEEPATVEDVFALDSGLETTLTYPAGSIEVSGTVGTVTVTGTGTTFASGDVGKYIRCGQGRGIVTAFTSTTEITADFQISIKERFPETENPPVFLSGEWSLTATFTSVKGLDHLEGETVQVFADGSVGPDAVVSGGAITLQQPASKVAVGLAYSGFVETLPITASNVVVENKEKSVVAAALRLFNSRGVSVGSSETGIFYEMKERTFEDYNEPTRLQSGVKEQSVTSGWSKSGSLTVKKNGPLSVTLLGLVLEVEVGDDS